MRWGKRTLTVWVCTVMVASACRAKLGMNPRRTWESTSGSNDGKTPKKIKADDNGGSSIKHEVSEASAEKTHGKSKKNQSKKPEKLDVDRTKAGVDPHSSLEKTPSKDRSETPRGARIDNNGDKSTRRKANNDKTGKVYGERRKGRQVGERLRASNSLPDEFTDDYPGVVCEWEIILQKKIKDGVWQGYCSKIASNEISQSVFVKSCPESEVQKHIKINAKFAENTPNFYGFCPDVSDKKIMNVVMEDVSEHPSTLKKEGIKLAKKFVEILNWCENNECPLYDISANNIVQDCFIDFEAYANRITRFYTSNELSLSVVENRRVALARALLYHLHSDWIKEQGPQLYNELRKDFFTAIVTSIHAFQHKFPSSYGAGPFALYDGKNGKKNLQSFGGFMDMLYIKYHIGKIEAGVRKNICKHYETEGGLEYLSNNQYWREDSGGTFREAHAKETLKNFLDTLPSAYPWKEFTRRLKKANQYNKELDEPLLAMATSGKIPIVLEP